MNLMLSRSLKSMIVSLLGAGLLLSAPSELPPATPMRVPAEENPYYKAARKKVLDSRLLDDMENQANWSVRGPGQISLTRERSRDGGHSIRLQAPTKLDKVPANQRQYAVAALIRAFSDDDWTNFNRVSFWVYPDLPGFRVVSLALLIHNRGVSQNLSVPGQFPVIENRNIVVVDNQRWNQVLWEIPHVDRSAVTAFEIGYRLEGNEPQAAETVTWDFDRLELQRVETDHFEGWDVAPGKIAFSHAGYATSSPKSAVAANLPATSFQLVRLETGETVLQKPLRTLKTALGSYQLLDFSEVRERGSYLIEAGDVRTRPFRIDDNPWFETIWKAINFFYCERCGIDIPGIHGACHRDWQAISGERKIIMNGGWHDAGDLSQGLGNTADAVYSMLSLAERLEERGEHATLRRRLLEEALWGLDWVLKTSFRDGNRVAFGVSSLWSNGILGDNDDITTRASQSPQLSFSAAAVEALAAHILKSRKPELAAHSLAMAREDWQFAVQGMKTANDRPQAVPRTANTGFTSFSAGQVELAAAGILASLDLYRATGDKSYAEYAVQLAPIIFNSQQRSFVGDSGRRFAGFFYTDPGKQRIVHLSHFGREQAPVLAMARLCDALPDHADWMLWYSVVVLYSEYWLKPAAAFTQPFGMLPNALYREEDAAGLPEGEAQLFRKQVLKGVPVGAGYYLRRFPVWSGVFRGNFGVTLGQAKALSVASGLRRQLALAQMAERQLQWILGLNPFAQSSMYGAGYDYKPMFTPHAGDIVGALPVGIQTRAENDVPYWPASIVATYKEVWVHPVATWLGVMRDLAGPALVTGQADTGDGARIDFCDAKTGAVVRAIVENGAFQAGLSPGEYTVKSGKVEKTVALMSGGRQYVDIRAQHALDFSAAQDTGAGGKVIIRVSARGVGTHRISVRTYNLKLNQTEREIQLQSGKEQSLTWTGQIEARDGPWVAVVVADDDVSDRKELTAVGGSDD